MKTPIQFPRKYNDTIYLDLGSWIDLKSSQLGFVFDVMNNLPLQSFNYEYKFHADLPITALFFQPTMLYQAIHTVIGSIDIRSGVGEGGVVVRNERELLRAILKGNKLIYTVLPKSRASVKQEAEFYNHLCQYTAVIERYIYREGRKRMYKAFGVLMGSEQ